MPTLSEIKPQKAISIYRESGNDENFIKNYILECFLNHQYDNIIDIVEKLENDIYGDLLIENKDKKFRASVFWMTIFFFHKKPSLIDILIKRGKCDINTLGTYEDRMFYGATPLFVACCLDSTEDCIRKLIDYNANVNIPDEFDTTPLMRVCCSCTGNYKFIIDKLISNNVDINFQNKGNGDTALHCAIESHRYDVALYLMNAAAADPFIENYAGEDATTYFPIHLGIFFEKYPLCT